MVLGEEVYSCDNCCLVDNMRYQLSTKKRKRSRSRSSDRSKPQLPSYGDKSAVLLNVKVLNTPPTPIRSSSLNRFQMIIAQQQKQVMSYYN